jgi:hypothetical protein
MPVLSTSRLSGPSARRYGIWTASVFCRRHIVKNSGTVQSRPAKRRKQTLQISFFEAIMLRLIVRRGKRNQPFVSATCSPHSADRSIGIL